MPMLEDLSPLSSPEPDALVSDEHPAALGDNLEEEPVLIEPPKPTRRKSRRIAAAQSKAVEDAELAESGDDNTPIPKQRRKSKRKVTSDNDQEFEDKKPRRKRRAKVQEPIVYDIPPVERKTTTFRGRLGYACLNTILRNQKPDPIFCSRTCRIDTIEKNGMDYLKNLGLQNAKDLFKLIEWNEQNRIKFMRISSELFPFASHDKYGYDLSYADETLKAAGELAKKYGHRLTTHPGQFTQLASPNPKVIESSIRELEYHDEMLTRMGLDQNAVMIIHMGGTYGDKAAALERFRVNYKERLSDSVKKRLVLENDEICYNLDDLMPVCEELDIPIVLDYHHDWINPSSRPVSELIPLIAKTWVKKGIRMKQHLSEPRPGATTVMQKRAHADRCKSLPEALPVDADLMIEAKDKEQAVFELYRVYGLEEVIWENLRPEKSSEEMTLQTAGRKSNRRTRKAVEIEAEAEAEPEDGIELNGT